jgi:hypothetical protein
MIRESNIEEHELSDLSHHSSPECFVEIELTPPSTPNPSSVIPNSAIAHALTHSRIYATGRRTDSGQASGWPGVVFNLYSVNRGPLQAGQIIEIEYTDFREIKTVVLGKILGRWGIQEKNWWILECEMVSDQVRGFHFLIILPKDARFLRPQSSWFKFLYPFLFYFLVREASYRE